MSQLDIKCLAAASPRLCAEQITQLAVHIVMIAEAVSHSYEECTVRAELSSQLEGGWQAYVCCRVLIRQQRVQYQHTHVPLFQNIHRFWRYGRKV